MKTTFSPSSGCEEKSILRTKIEKIYAAGIRSVCLEARPHPEYAGEGWWHDVDIVIDEVKKRGMTIWILDDAHFPTGMANNAMKEDHPEKVRRFLVSQFVDVVGPMPAAQVDVELLTTRQFTWMDFGKPDYKPLLNEMGASALADRSKLVVLPQQLVSDCSIKCSG